MVDTKPTALPDKPQVVAKKLCKDDSCNAGLPLEGKLKHSKKTCKTQQRNSSGNIKKDLRFPNSYSARISFDCLELDTRYCDLQTALENLLILTSVKQKMRVGQNKIADFKERLQEALVSSAKEHGEEYADLQLRFAVAQAAGVFIGARILIRTPRVRSLEVLGQIRSCLDPFRIYAQRGSTRSRAYQWHTPGHLEDAWEKLQVAVAEAWRLAGADSSVFLQKCHALREANGGVRTKQLENWERHHMSMEDKNMNRPRGQQEATSHYREQRERRQMAMHDKNPSRPQAMRKRRQLEKRERQQMAKEDRLCKKSRPPKNDSQDPLANTLLQLKKLLVRWGNLIKNEASLAEKERQKLLKQRKDERDKQRRDEALHRKRRREEERLRREAIRKRMKSDDLTMNDIPWV